MCLRVLLSVFALSLLPMVFGKDSASASKSNPANKVCQTEDCRKYGWKTPALKRCEQRNRGCYTMRFRHSQPASPARSPRFNCEKKMDCRAFKIGTVARKNCERNNKRCNGVSLPAPVIVPAPQLSVNITE